MANVTGFNENSVVGNNEFQDKTRTDTVNHKQKLYIITDLASNL